MKKSGAAVNAFSDYAFNIFLSIVVIGFLLFISGCKSASEGKKQLTDKERMKLEASATPGVEKKVLDLLSKMTLEEKVGQMVQIMPGKSLDSSAVMHGQRNVGAVYFNMDDMETFSMKQWFDMVTAYQNTFFNNNRLKIPLIIAQCHQHGAVYVKNATIFPHNLTLAATFTPRFGEDMGNVTVLESADLGHNFVWVPVMDVGRNHRWSRFFETMGESSYLCARMGDAIVKGVQDTIITSPYKVAACIKHFIGYSDPRSGWDRSPVIISDQELYEYYVPSFMACIDAGAKIIEANSGEVNGIPVHASHRLLTTLLRDELGFKGLLNSDYEDIRKLATYHHVAPNEKEAAYLGVMAGLDLVLTPFDMNFADDVIALVKEGRISEERINLSVARVLRLKFELGLFEHPYPRNDRFDRLARPESTEKALAAAREAIVLLKNDNNLLPLHQQSSKRILVTGFNANKRMATSGGWTRPTNSPKAKTVFEGITEQFQKSKVTLVDSDIAKIKSGAKEADVIIYAAGEDPYSEQAGNIQEMDLPDDQVDQIKAAISTGKPVILIMIAGRPRTITKVFDQCKAVLWAGLPGYEGARAIAEILDGTVNPSGKLPFAYPYTDSRNLTYNQKYHDLQLTKNLKVPWTIADFGSGLSYTSFTYSDIQLSDTIINGKNASLKAMVKVTNTGKLEGKEAVLWFLWDEVGSITRPIRELKYFEKEMIKSGESKTFTFLIDPIRDLSFPNEKGEKLIEEGYFTLSVGNQVARFRLKGL
ncbi:MAG: glycoside hydrolase family 3 C-terminal domain-containing protein [Prolixibacteraceae bacterium]|jgi:beta-glucosidase|nr:glycoside hydrolase family 3 C-terminal domain-containing protein [Prolixibacteraceae bacterium]